MNLMVKIFYKKSQAVLKEKDQVIIKKNRQKMRKIICLQYFMFQGNFFIIKVFILSMI